MTDISRMTETQALQLAKQSLETIKKHEDRITLLEERHKAVHAFLLTVAERLATATSDDAILVEARKIPL